MAKFKPRARSLDLLGKQQIAGAATALNELFKNAYDAYADNVQADYYESNNIFLLRDDGLGMTQEDFESRWLTLGTESKLETEYGVSKPATDQKRPKRPVMGEKGIGRLAIAALGDQVLVITKARREDETHGYVIAYINWSMFELPGIDLDEIDIPIECYDSLGSITSTEIKNLTEVSLKNLELLQDKIAITTYNRIKVQIENFNIPDTLLKFEMDGPNIHNGGTAFVIKPAGERLVYDINNTINSDEASNLHLMLCGFSNTMMGKPVPIITSFIFHSKNGGKLDLIGGRNFFSPEEYQSTDHHIEGEFDEYGNFSGNLSIYHSKPERVEFNLNETNKKLDCGAFKISFGYLQGMASESLLSPEDHAKLVRKLNGMGGLYIYKDGIRILPYGRPDFDFLELERKRSFRASTYFFSYRRMIGAIELERKNNSNLTEKAGREGFQESSAYTDFKGVLETFLLRLAQKYFSGSDEAATDYKEDKARIKQDHERRKEREKSQKSYHNKLNKELDKFFDYIEPTTINDQFISMFQSDLLRIERLPDQLDSSTKKSNDPLKNMRMIKDIEDELRTEVSRISDRIKIDRNNSIGLTKDLARRWEYYTQKSDECSNQLEQKKHDVYNRISFLIKDFDLDASQWLQNKIDNLHKEIEKKLSEEKKSISLLSNKLEKQVDSFSEDIAKKEQEILAGVNKKLSKFGQSTKADDIAKLREEIDTEFNTFEQTVSKAFEQLRATLDTVSNNLLSAIENNQEEYILTNAKELGALESELTRLKEEYEENIENIQIGLAVKVINHEFSANIIGVRKAIQDLKGWADNNPGMQGIYGRIKDGFDHLDTYMNMFTPLERRLNRRATHISGKSIAEFMQKLFEERLKQEQIELKITSAFLKNEIVTYPSTIHPVFINLIDNAIYWLSTTDVKEKIIMLDADKNGILIIDNGPGIKEIDQPYIFERGFTKKISGGGMGLYIAKTVLNKENFDLKLEKTSSDGTEFRITAQKTL